MYNRKTKTTKVFNNDKNDINLIHPFTKTTKDFAKNTQCCQLSLDMVLNIGLVLGLALLIRLCISNYPYSGANKPPMYGDYEAQRHWQEITLNLPISQWYTNSSDNDLQYWGLDYPPITAYHSLILGHIADPKTVKLHESRGHESSAHKYFMRLTVIAIDLLIFIPAVLYLTFSSLPFYLSLNEKQVFSSTKMTMALLCYPGIILIDHGHFQYNCVSLGLFIASVSLILKDSIMLASCFFVLALNYKQMELYHALPFFFYILGLVRANAKQHSFISSLYLLIQVSLTVLVTFVAIWAPFFENFQVLTDAVLRQFPFNRGIFEDKVANIWCAINVLYKLKSNISNTHLASLCLVTTVCALLPSSLDLFYKPLKGKFLLALINSSLAFFLFSFQVHEKSILLVAVPVLLHWHNDPFYCFWFLNVSVFSMLPLFIKDNLFVAYVASSIFFIVLVFAWIEPQFCRLIKNNYIGAAFGLSLAGILLISICSITVKPPKKYPDLYSLLISVYSCSHFFIFLIYFNCKQIFVTFKDKLE